MSSAEPIRLCVDFNYGGLNPETQQGAVMLHPKFEDRTGMKADVREQFELAGVEPSEGMSLLLIDQRSTSDEEGRLCDMIVIGKLRWDSERQRWYATYHGHDMTLLPCEPD